MRKINFNDFTLIPSERRLLCASHDVVLNPKAFDLLTILAENPGQVITKEEIIERLWPDSSVEEGNLAVQISNLRSALRFFSQDPIIRTVPGIGYCFAMGISETEDGAIDTRCNHGGSCAGLVITSPPLNDVSQKTLKLMIDCLENAASERDEIHLYSRKPHRGIQRANGGLFLEIRFKQVETLGKSGIALEFTNPSTDEVRFRIVVSERDFKTVDQCMDVARRVMRNFCDRVILGWKQSEEMRVASSRNFIDNMIAQAAFLVDVETPESIIEAEILIDKALEFDVSDSRLHLMKVEIQILKACAGLANIEDIVEFSKVLIERASHSGASDNELMLVTASITGLLLRDPAEAINRIRSHSDPKSLSKKESIVRADLLSSLNRFDEAKLSLQKALELDPLSFSAMRRLAASNLASGNIEAATRSARSLLRFLPYDQVAISVIEACEDPSMRAQAPKATSSSSGDGSARSSYGTKKRKRSGDLIDKREHLRAVSMFKEFMGDNDSASAYRRLVKLLDQDDTGLSTKTGMGTRGDTPFKKPTTKFEHDGESSSCE